VTNLHPIHHSMRMPRRLPKDMSRVRMDHEEVSCLTEMVLSIFTDCSNVGLPFQDTLLAIYLSGLQHGQALAEEEV
jgi:hypothetical protein